MSEKTMNEEPKLTEGDKGRVRVFCTMLNIPIPEWAMPDTKTNPTQTRRMTMITQDEAIKKILYHYGVQRQKLKLIEEAGELIQAIAKSPDNIITDNMVNEIADVQVMIDQMCIAMSADQKKLLHDMTAYKIRRQLVRMEGD